MDPRGWPLLPHFPHPHSGAGERIFTQIGCRAIAFSPIEAISRSPCCIFATKPVLPWKSKLDAADFARVYATSALAAAIRYNAIIPPCSIASTD
jgi:hypothetical protein